MERAQPIEAMPAVDVLSLCLLQIHSLTTVIRGTSTLTHEISNKSIFVCNTVLYLSCSSKAKEAVTADHDS